MSARREPTSMPEHVCAVDAARARLTGERVCYWCQQSVADREMTKQDWRALYIVMRLQEQVVLYGAEALDTFVSAVREPNPATRPIEGPATPTDTERLDWLSAFVDKFGSVEMWRAGSNENVVISEPLTDACNSREFGEGAALRDAIDAAVLLGAVKEAARIAGGNPDRVHIVPNRDVPPNMLDGGFHDVELQYRPIAEPDEIP